MSSMSDGRIVWCVLVYKNVGVLLTSNTVTSINEKFTTEVFIFIVLSLFWADSQLLYDF